MEKIFYLAVGVCSCLQTCNSVVDMLALGLVLGLSLMVISITGILLSLVAKYRDDKKG